MKRDWSTVACSAKPYHLVCEFARRIGELPNRCKHCVRRIFHNTISSIYIYLIIMYFALVSSPEKVTVEWVCCKMSGRVEYHAGWGGGLNDIMCLTCTAHAPGSSGTMTYSQTVFSCDGYLCHHGKHCAIRTLFARTEELTKTTAQDQVSSQSSDTAIYRTYLWYLSCKTAAHI